MHKHNLTDIYKMIYMAKKKQARLDYVTGTHTLMDIHVVQSCKMLYGYRSDHSRTELDL